MCSSPATTSCRPIESPNTSRNTAVEGWGGSPPGGGGTSGIALGVVAGPVSRPSRPLRNSSDVIEPCLLPPGPLAARSRPPVASPNHRPGRYQAARPVLVRGIPERRRYEVHRLRGERRQARDEILL